MNWLQLAQAVKREAALSGGGPVAYSTASGDDARIFQWVNWAARDITLSREDWRWRRGAATLASTTAKANAYSAFGLTDFASWKPDSRFYHPSAYRVSDGIASEKPLMWLAYEDYRRQFLTGAPATGAVQYWSISPAEEFLIGPEPDGAHFVRADYVKDYTDLSADASTPTIPTRFHMLIVWKALMEYGGFDAATEVFQRAQLNYLQMWPQLVQSQLEAPSIVARGLA